MRIYWIVKSVCRRGRNTVSQLTVLNAKRKDKGDMETKKIGRLMLGIFLLNVAATVFLAITAGQIEIGLLLSLALGELLLLFPGLVYLICYKLSAQRKSVSVPKEVDVSSDMNVAADPDVLFDTDAQKDEKKVEPIVLPKEPLKSRLHYNKIKWSTVAYVLFYTWLSMPLTTLLNAFSMLFVDNTVLTMTPMFLQVSFPVMLFLMAVMPACIEELVFRGITYGGYRRSGTKFMAVMLSALMFGLMHMNLNQALYAFVLGILLALLFEATGSIFATMLFHFIYNAQSCCMIYLMEFIEPGYYSEAANVVTPPEQIIIMIAIYLIISAICTPLAFCLLYKIAKNENREKELAECLPGKQKGKERLITVSFVLATIIAVAYITLETALSMMMK